MKWWCTMLDIFRHNHPSPRLLAAEEQHKRSTQRVVKASLDNVSRADDIRLTVESVLNEIEREHDEEGYKIRSR